MNKKIVSILIIFSLLAVSLSSISANDTNIDEQNIADMQKEVTEIGDNLTSEENNTTDENNTLKNYSDILVSSDPKDLENFNILMNFVTPEGLDYFADQLAKIDETTYKDVITALRNNDRENLLKNLVQLDQDKIDVFFDEFLKIFDTTYQEHNDKATDIISNTVSQIFGSTQSTSSNIPTNNFIKVESTNGLNQNNPQFSYDGKYYSIIDFVNLLKSLYENGDITYDQFIEALQENGIDTSNIKVEDGVIEWGYLYIIPQNVDPQPDDTNSTIDDNETADNSINGTNSANSGNENTKTSNNAENVESNE